MSLQANCSCLFVVDVLFYQIIHIMQNSFAGKVGPRWYQVVALMYAMVWYVWYICICICIINGQEF